MRATEAQIKHLHSLKRSTKLVYDRIDTIYCPILKEPIVFNSIGFRHLLIKPDGTFRDTREAIYKLKLFPLAIPTIKKAQEITDEREYKIAVGRGKRRKYKNAKTYSLVACVGTKEPVMIRVIILRVGDGNYNFFSIMKN